MATPARAEAAARRPVFWNNSRREETGRFASLMVGLRLLEGRAPRSGERDPRVVGGENRQDRQTRRSRMPATVWPRVPFCQGGRPQIPHPRSASSEDTTQVPRLSIMSPELGRVTGAWAEPETAGMIPILPERRVRYRPRPGHLSRPAGRRGRRAPRRKKPRRTSRSTPLDLAPPLPTPDTTQHVPGDGRSSVSGPFGWLDRNN